MMMSTSLVASKHTCYKFVTSLSTRAHNVNALNTCHALLRLVSAENKIDPRTRVLARKTLLLMMLTITPPP